MEQILNYISNKYNFGLDISQIVQINSSTNNQVFDLGDFILKISGNKYNLKKEFDILNLINGRILCPRPILYDEFEGNYFLIIHKIEGETLDHYWLDFDQQNQESVIHDIISNMKLLHSISDDCFVDYVNGDKIQSNNYFDILKIKLDKIKSKSFENKDVSKDRLRNLIDYFEDNKNVFYDEKPSLVHNDLWYKNIMYDKFGKVFMIDFETSIYAPKQIELFVIHNHFISAKNYLDKDPQDYKEFDFLTKFISAIKSEYSELYNYDSKQEILYNILKYFNLVSNFDKPWYNYSNIINFENNIKLI